MAKIANVALSNTFDLWRTRSNQSFDRLSQFAINNSSLYANTLTANVSFTSKGLATLQGRATVGTNLTVSGNTAIGASNKSHTITGVINHTGNAIHTGNVAISGTLANVNSFGFYATELNYSQNKIRNFVEDAKSYTNSSTAYTVTTNRNVQRVTLNGNATVTLPAQMPGKTDSVKSIILVFKQDGTGGRTMTLATANTSEAIVYNNSASAPPIASGANKHTIYICTKFDLDTNWYVSQSFIEA